jgi:hypothetical protein
MLLNGTSIFYKTVKPKGSLVSSDYLEGPAGMAGRIRSPGNINIIFRGLVVGGGGLWLCVAKAIPVEDVAFFNGVFKVLG